MSSLILFAPIILIMLAAMVLLIMLLRAQCVYWKGRALRAENTMYQLRDECVKLRRIAPLGICNEKTA